MTVTAQSAPSAIGGAWLAPLRDWPRAAVSAVRRDGAVARVVVASVLGSAPREVGTAMLVERSRVLGTIGGGHLEWTAIAAARALLSDTTLPSVRVERFVLGPQLGQCCGGVVELLIERYARNDLPLLATVGRAARDPDASLSISMIGGRSERSVLRVSGGGPRLVRSASQVEWREPLAYSTPSVWLYGAGHVGQALARVVSDLPMHLTWIDSRAELLPDFSADSIDQVRTTDPVATVKQAPPDACFVVMTHSHALDYELCRAILERGDQRWVGVIGSQSKGARFRSRLARDGVPASAIEHLTCPIGVAGVRSKDPAAIAVAVAAQLLQVCTDRPMIADEPLAALAGCAVDDSGACAACGKREQPT